MKICITAAHAGYDSEEIPIGGAAAMCERICAAWAGREGLEVLLLGTGPRPPGSGVHYERLASLGEVPPSKLSALQYAAFSQRFSREVTRRVATDPSIDVVLVNDISEGPDYAGMGKPCVSLVHVDVVEFFTDVMMRGIISAPTAARWYEKIRRWRLLPAVFELVFERQARMVDESSLIVVPAPGVQQRLEQCYPGRGRYTLVPWGCPADEPGADEVARERERLMQAWKLAPGQPVVVTLSRISYQKGQDRLLRAWAWGEERGEVPPGATLVICGEPSYMQGEAFYRHIRKLASRLRSRVIFPGHVGGATKRAALELATLFVSPSRYETYGLTTMEAFAAGLPAVATHNHGNDYTVTPSCGVLCRPEPPSLWRAVSSLLSDVEARARLAAGARQRAASESFAACAERLLEVASDAARAGSTFFRASRLQ